MKDFDKKYDPEKYAKNLDKVELDVAKKTGDSYDKAQKKAKKWPFAATRPAQLW